MATLSDNDDAVSVTSTIASEPQDEYPVETILAEDNSQEGVPLYLVKWEGYPLDRFTWEPNDSFTDSATLQDWEQRKARIEAGAEPPFDLNAWEAEIRLLYDSSQKRRKVRRQKRQRLGLPTSTSPSEDEYDSETVDSIHRQTTTSIPESSAEETKIKGISDLPEDNTTSRPPVAGGKTRTLKPVQIPDRISGVTTLQSNSSLGRQSSATTENRSVSSSKLQEGRRGSRDGQSMSSASSRSSSPKKSVRYQGTARPTGELKHPSSACTTTQPSRAKHVTRPNRSGAMGAVGRGPARATRKDAKPKKTGASIFKDWDKPKAKRGTHQAAGLPSTASSGSNFKNLSQMRKAELRGRNEPPPDPSFLTLLNPREGTVVQHPPYTSTGKFPDRRRSSDQTLFLPQDPEGPGTDLDSLFEEPQVNFATAPVGQPGSTNASGHLVIDPPTSSARVSAVEMGKVQSASGNHMLNEKESVNDFTGPENRRLPSVGLEKGATVVDSSSRSLLQQNVTKRDVAILRTDDSRSTGGSRIIPSHAHLISRTASSVDKNFAAGVPVKLSYERGTDVAIVGEVMLLGLDDSSKQNWQNSVGDNADICFSRAISVQDYRSFLGEGFQIYAEGGILSTKQSTNEVENLATILRRHTIGGVFLHDHFLMLVYPAAMEEWRFLTNPRASVSPGTALKYLLQSRYPQPHHATVMGRKRPSVDQVPRHLSDLVWDQLFGLNAQRLLSINGKSPEMTRNVFLMLPDQPGEDCRLFLGYLQTLDIELLTNHSKGAWHYWTRRVETGTLMIHSSVYDYHKIPRFSKVLLRPDISIFEFGVMRIESSLTDNTELGFQVRRIFPKSSCYLLHDDIILKDPSSANDIVQWFVKEVATKPHNKLICRPNIVEWMLELSESHPSRSPLFAAAYALEALIDTYLQPDGTIDDGCPIFIEEKRIWNSYPVDEPHKAREYSVEFFAGYCATHADQLRRCTIIHSAGGCAEEQVWRDNWKEKYQHCIVMSSDEFIESVAAK